MSCIELHVSAHMYLCVCNCVFTCVCKCVFTCAHVVVSALWTLSFSAPAVYAQQMYLRHDLILVPPSPHYVVKDANRGITLNRGAAGIVHCSRLQRSTIVSSPYITSSESRPHSNSTGAKAALFTAIELVTFNASASSINESASQGWQHPCLPNESYVFIILCTRPVNVG